MAALCLVGALATTTAFVAQEAWEDEDPANEAAVHSVQGPGGAANTSGRGAAVQDSGSSANVYEAITSREVSSSVSGIKPRVYVPNNGSNTVDVIDPSTYRVVGHFDVGYGPQHITPSWDLRHLYVGNTYSNTITVIDPRTGKPVGTKRVYDTYNLYFTPDGTRAIDVAERMNTLFVYDPRTWKILDRVTIPWAGADHLDFSADGSYLLLSTEYAGRLVKVNLRTMKVTGSLALGGSPVDVKVSPDGRYFFVANQIRDGVSVVDPDRMKEVAFIPTGKGAHGFCVSRDARSLYVANRLAGTISVMDFATHRIEKTWTVGGSPDMLQVTPDGRQLWVSNRYDSTVSVIDTTSGKVLHVIRVGTNPHGLTYFPQPGRFSIGHNGVYR